MTTGLSAAAPGGTPRRTCKCEARIASAILDGYACGNPDCWRTEAAKASFADFVADLIRTRGDTPPLPAEQRDRR